MCRVFYHQLSSTDPQVESVETDRTSYKISNLKPNSQYTIHAVAIAARSQATPGPAQIVESRASETLLAWTDPAFPAFVEVIV